MNKERKNIELQHQAKVVAWCRERGIKICGTTQNTFTNSWKALNDNKRAGVVKGLPDLIIIIPPKYRKNNLGKVIHIEMKKPKSDGGGVVSKEQREWIEALDGSEGINARVCYGYHEAILYIESFMELEPPPLIKDPKKMEEFINNL
jgi:hypothetical protein